MRKWIAAILAIALLAMSVSVLAEENTQASPQQDQTQTTTESSQKLGNGHKDSQKNKKEKSGETDAVSGATSTPDNGSDKPQENSRQGENSKDGRQFPDTQKPDNGQMRKGSRPPQNGSGSQDKQAPGNEQGQNKSRKPGGEQKQKKGKSAKTTESQTPKLDPDSFVTQGIISQETADQIKAYLEAHPAEDAAEVTGILKVLLDAEIITQNEYEAMLAASTVTTV